MKQKNRLDYLIYKFGFAESREKSKAIIMAGLVYVNNQKSDKPGSMYDETVKIEVRGKPTQFVSRGGLKLDKAVKNFDIKLKDNVCIDVGASTGGFTDCMLQNGAKKIYAVDVGYGQLSWKLRIDNRIINLERTNIRYITKKEIPDKVDFISIDVSFISLCLVLPVIKKFMKDGAKALCLVKPQFEAGRAKVGKNGVVKDINVHIEVMKNIKTFVLFNGFNIKNFDFSPIKGPRGNIEYLIYLEKSKENFGEILDDKINHVIESSHIELNR